MAVKSNITGFLNTVKQGVRNNLFVVEFNFPSVMGSDAPRPETLQMLCKSAAIPASNLGVIEVPFRGRTVKIAGDRTFDTWTITVISDRNQTLRHGFEKWIEGMNRHNANNASTFVPDTGATGYLQDLVVKQLERNAGEGDTDASVLRTYYFKGAFPTNISQIDLAYDSNDQIEDFTVEFQYQYWSAEPGTGAQPAAGGGRIGVET